MILKFGSYQELASFWDNGFRHLSNRVRPIRDPGDCRGLRIRTRMSDLHGETFRALGFEPAQSDVKDFTEQIGGDRLPAATRRAGGRGDPVEARSRAERSDRIVRRLARRVQEGRRAGTAEASQ